MEDVEWGPWINHDADYPKATIPNMHEYVHVIYDDYSEAFGFAYEFDAVWFPTKFIIRYRIRRPKGLKLLQNLLNETEKTKELVKG